MKTIINSTIFILFFVLNACQSQEQKTDESIERYKADKQKINAEIAYSKGHPKVQIQTKTIIVPTPLNEHQLFTNRLLQKIANNELVLKNIKLNKNLGDKNFRKAMRAERDNNNMRIAINEYQVQAKVLWDQYHKAMTDDMKKLDDGIADIHLK